MNWRKETNPGDDGGRFDGASDAASEVFVECTTPTATGDLPPGLAYTKTLLRPVAAAVAVVAVVAAVAAVS